LEVYWRPKRGAPNPNRPGEKLSISMFRPCEPEDSCYCGSGRDFQDCCRDRKQWPVVTPDPGGMSFSRAPRPQPERLCPASAKRARAARRLKNRSMEGAHLGNLGLAYADLGETRRAIEFYEQTLEIDREIGDRRGEGADPWNMSLAFDQLGQRERAFPLAEAALQIREQIEDLNAEKVRRKLTQWRGESS
jgi:tetratricopeptide (TPR) repeat protein